MESQEAGRALPDLSRRGLLQATVALGCASAGFVAQGQPVSEAALEAKAPPLPALGSLLHVPAIDLLGGGRFDPAQSSGKPLLVYWWSSTCPFCALQSPSMEAFWRAHQSKNFDMLALSIDRKPEDAVRYLKQKGYTFPAAWVSPRWREAYPKPRGLPITLLADAKSRLLLAEKGQMFPEDVEAMAALL